MDKKQDIGAAIKNKLENYSQAPANADVLWDNIASQLDDESSGGRVLPFWLRTGSAVLVGAIALISIWYIATDSGSSDTDNPIQVTQTDIIEAGQDKNSDADNFNKQQVVDNTNESNVTESTNSATTNANQLEVTTTDQQEVVSSESKSSIASETNPDNTEGVANSANSVGTTTTATSTGQNSVTNTNAIVSANTSGNTSANTSNTSTTSGNTPAAKQDASTTATTTSSTSYNVPYSNSVNTNTTGTPSGFYVWSKNSIQKQEYKSPEIQPLVLLENQSLEKATALPVIAYNANVSYKKSKEARRLERELRKEELNDYKWTIGPMVAPTSYGSLTKGSMLDARLEGNPREGETNLSYGLRVKNKFAKRSSLRFGVNRINLGYNTQNFQVNIIDDIVNVYQLTGIDPGNEIQNGGVSLDPQATAFFQENDVVALDQDISYLEFPVEYEYALLNTRLGANLIGGTSLIVLDDNRIAAVSNNGESVNVGQSNNLSNFGFTLNFGMGLNYEISKHLQFNVDPIFKIQMNTPENNSINNFKPYYFGIYSGLSFKF